MTIKFYDTSSLLIKIPNEFFYISSVTIEELENIKVSSNKDFDIKVKTREISRFLINNPDSYKVILYKDDFITPELQEYNLTNDIKVLACALSLGDDVEFYTNDILLSLIAKNHFNNVKTIENDEEEYSGIIEITLSDEELVEYYSNLHNNIFNLYVGQYVIIKNKEGEVIDKACWTGECMRQLQYDDFNSGTFGRLKPKKNDPYQACLFDCLEHNQVTLITGKPGSGKTLLALSYLFSLLGKEIDQIVIFCNPVVVRNGAKLGFYPGTVTEKLLSTQMGNILSSKLGEKLAVDNLINEGTLILIPVGDSRGYEVPPNSGVFITEGQNYNIDLLRLLLERCEEDTKVIIEGDIQEQVDVEAYAGANSGIRAMSKAFRGDEIFGQVELKNIYRSHIAELADSMGRY